MIDPFKFTILSSRPVGQRCIAWVKDTSSPDDRYLYTNAPEEAGIVISVMYDKLLTEEFIMDRRCYNFHPGLLPQQRGSGAFSWAIINGEECGITLHQLDVGMDTGPIIDQMVIAQGDTWTAEQLHDRGMELMLEMFKNWLVRLLWGKHTATTQDESKARTYYRRDLQKQLDLTRYARAFTFEGKAKAFYYNRHGQKIELEY